MKRTNISNFSLAVDFWEVFGNISSREYIYAGYSTCVDYSDDIKKYYLSETLIK